MYVCMYVRVCRCQYVHMYACFQVRACAWMYRVTDRSVRNSVCTDLCGELEEFADSSVYTHTDRHTYTHTNIYIYIYTYTYTYIYIHIHIYTYMLVCRHTHTHIYVYIYIYVICETRPGDMIITVLLRPGQASAPETGLGQWPPPEVPARGRAAVRG